MHMHRFIPACAGNSPFAVAGRRPRAVHPRVCGELIIASSTANASAGSSPRVRGTRKLPVRAQQVRRFIPACAGNSTRDCNEDGEHDGSSPRVRGTPRIRCWRTVVVRFIPACAGNSCCRSTSWCSDSVHPRVCGELVRRRRVGSALSRFIPACAGNSSPSLAGALAATGSSPRVRGTRLARTGSTAGRRFIPACAGNSGANLVATDLTSVHPRVCGELRIGPDVDDPRVLGSSPRVRGTHSCRLPCDRSYRFIPACAGNSTCSSSVGARASVHPRVCGELGLRCADLLASARFIPACAGNSAAPCSPARP